MCTKVEYKIILVTIIFFTNFNLYSLVYILAHNKPSMCNTGCNSWYEVTFGGQGVDEYPK